MKFRLNNKEATFNNSRSMKQSGDIRMVYALSFRVESTSEVQIDECLGVEALAAVIINFESDGIEEYGSLIAALEQGNYRSKPKKLELYMKHRKSPSMKQSIKQAPKLELKALPPYLRYVLWGRYDTSPVIIASDLNVQ